MRRILIATELKDIHALAVAHALRLKGHQPVLWYGADFPTVQQGSICISPGEEFSWDIAGPGIALTDNGFDVVWYRRATLPVLPADMHPGDRKVAQAECRAFISGLWRTIAPNAFWVNPLNSRESANSKPLQLVEANRVGLQVPLTLCSNDPERIRRFIEAHDGDVIYKPFWPALWEKSDEGIALLLTSTISLAGLPDDDVLRLSPGIFQPKIEKEYELRVTYMGDYNVAAKLFSQENAAFQLDWRNVFTSADKNMRIERALVPDDIDHACRCLMNRLGIVFGCFDFIVTPQGDYVFLEVNEMGQFIWVEQLNPEIKILEPFVEFLVKGGLEREWESQGDLNVNDFRSELANHHLREELPLHIARPNEYAVDD